MDEFDEVKRVLLKYVLPGVLVLALLISVGNSIRIIQPGFVGVNVRLGAAQDESLTEGLHLVVPFITSVYRIDTRIQKAEINGNEAASKDLQIVTSAMVINYHLEKDSVVRLYRQIGLAYEDVVIAPGVQEVFKAATAEFTAESLITQRQTVSEIIRKGLQERFEPYGIIVDQVNITNFDFSADFNRAIEAKVTAEQNALKAEKDLERFKFEAQQKVATAKGEAEALVEKARAEAESLQLRLQYAKPEIIMLNAVEKWDGKLPQLLGAQTPIPFVNVERPEN